MQKEHKNISPPHWAQRFLEWYCRAELLEDLQGDLNEYFQRNVTSKGIRRARFIYFLDVLKFLRLYTLRKPEFINLLINFIMIGSYIKTSGRSIIRNKLFSAINIIGLAVSMSVGLLVIAFVSDLLSYDDFHEKKSRIYKVNSTVEDEQHQLHYLATSSVMVGKEIQSTITGIEKVTLMRRDFVGDATVEEKTIPVKGLWADESFFNVFSFSIIEGNPSVALKEPYAVVLTEKTAMKLFGATEALGKSIKFEDQDYVISGIIKDIPQLSHMDFDLLVSFATVELQKPDFDGGWLAWDNIYSNYTYIVLPEDGNASAVQSGLDKLASAKNTNSKGRPISLSLQPLSEVPFSNMGNPIGPGVNKIVLYILGSLAFVIILSACFNYTNLSIARSLRRSREVGIRKVIGASKSHVLGQFIAESVIISLLALVFSFLLFLFLRGQFLSFHPFITRLLTLQISGKLVFWFVVMSIAVGVIAGFLPALFFSKINAVQVLKDASTLKVFRNVSMRKALIVVQYTFSLIFITSTVIGYKQYKGFLTFDLGFKTENILNIKLGEVKSNQLIKELSELPEVTQISRSVIITSLGSIYGGDKLNYKSDSADVWQNVIDENYLPLHEHKFVVGRNFVHKAEDAEESEVIVNEQILKKMNIGSGDPNKALGEVVRIEGKELTIIGVIKDFHYGTLENTIEPLVLRYASENSFQYVNAKISTTDWPATLALIENAWKKVDKVHPLDAQFYDDQIEQAYSQFSVILKVIGFLALLAVCIASMGLFGMVVFTAETKLKEISIRKVLGASEEKLIYLLSKGFLVLLALSALIALPATYFFFDKVLLASYAYHQPIQPGELLIGVLIVMAIAFLMIGSQTFKVARSNPAQVLKSE